MTDETNPSKLYEGATDKYIVKVDSDGEKKVLPVTSIEKDEEKVKVTMGGEDFTLSGRDAHNVTPMTSVDALKTLERFTQPNIMDALSKFANENLLKTRRLFKINVMN